MPSDSTPAPVADTLDDFEFGDGQDDEQLALVLDSIQAAYHVTQTRVSSAQQTLVDTIAADDPASDFIQTPLLDEVYTVPRKSARSQRHDEPEALADPDSKHTDPSADTRSPLERFRNPPKRTLSVSDFVGPAYCELKYWYGLVKFGKQRATPAMKRGNQIHKKLEREVKVSVKVDIKTKEDYFGVRVWNIIQSLRSLRLIGLTRELQVWGFVQGQLINGVIDHLSYTCPDPDAEQSYDAQHDKPENQRPADQKSISDYFSSQDTGTERGKQPQQANDRGKVFITDVKTRGVASIPQDYAFFPTKIQLMLYRNLLVQMATGQVDPRLIFARNAVDPDKPFSDVLIRQLSSVGEESPRGESDSEYGETPATDDVDIDTVAELLGHNNLTQLWHLMMEEFKLTFPNGEASVGQVLSAEYRKSSDGVIIGTKSCLNDPANLTSYVFDEMRWWYGERPVKGVDLGESFKCRACEFSEICEWRIGKANARLEKSQAKQEADGMEEKKKKKLKEAG